MIFTANKHKSVFYFIRFWDLIFTLFVILKNLEWYFWGLNVLCCIFRDFLSGDFMAGDVMSYVARIGDFMSGDFVSGELLTWIPNIRWNRSRQGQLLHVVFLPLPFQDFAKLAIYQQTSSCFKNEPIRFYSVCIYILAFGAELSSLFGYIENHVAQTLLYIKPNGWTVIFY